MMDSMDDRLFQWWQKFFQEEPFGPQTLNLMLARIAAAAAQEPDEGRFLPRVNVCED